MSCEHEHHNHSHTAPIPTNESQSLLAKIDTPHVSGLNMENVQEDLAKVFRSPQQKYQLKPVVKSDCDSQMIINIPFVSGTVKLFSVILRTNGDIYCPKTIKFFKNRDVDFDNVETTQPTHTVTQPRVGVMYNDDDEMPETAATDAEFVEHYLPRHKFTGVSRFTMFIEDIYGDEDVSAVHYIELRGEFTELTKDPVIAIYESAANPADHKAVEEVNFAMQP